ncbi:MAG: hypothetical protein WCU88_05930 [Elusimicrobiota bacterium]|jgi:hypothetical protein
MKNNSDNAPATKADLHTLDCVLRADIDGLRKDVKSDMDGLRKDVKADIGRLEEKTDKLSLEFVKSCARTDRQFAEMRSEMHQGFERITGIVESFAQRLESYDRESAVFPRMLDEHGRSLRDHEARLRSLESARKT